MNRRCFLTRFVEGFAEYVEEVFWELFHQLFRMIQTLLLLLPILPQMDDASLEDLALGLPKLSALGLSMLPLHRFG